MRSLPLWEESLSFKGPDWLLRNPEVHYRPYISPPFNPILSKIFSVSRVTTQHPQIHFNIVLQSTPQSPWRSLSLMTSYYKKNFYGDRNRFEVIYIGGEGWLGFPDLWSGQKHWWNWYLSPVVNFGEVWRTQLAKSTLLTSTLVPLGSFQIF